MVTGEDSTMKRTVQLLLMTARVSEARASGLLGDVRRGARGVRILEVARFPGPSCGALSPRQAEILRELALGASVKEIAVLFGISAKTVETHRAQLMKRLGTRRVPELVRVAIQRGMLPAGWLTERREYGRNHAVATDAREAGGQKTREGPALRSRMPPAGG
jgi:DNA-binding CsgD family transcriptional regulator